MIEDYKIKGLQKLANSGVIMSIYPMVDHIEIRSVELSPRDRYDRLEVDIHLNDENITKDDMYDSDFDPHYLIDHWLVQYLPYFDMDKVIFDFIVWSPNGDIIYSWKD
jgi:hypothetical protein